MHGHAVSRPQGATQNCELPLDGSRESVPRLNEFIRALRKQCFFCFDWQTLNGTSYSCTGSGSFALFATLMLPRHLAYVWH
jgi:hypothetical protein